MTLSNEALLEELRRRIESGELPRSALDRFLADAGVGPDNASMESARDPGTAEASAPTALPAFSVTRLLYVVGGLLVVLGAGYLMSQLWDDMGSPLRIFATLGLGLVMAGVGSVFMIAEPERELGSVFHAVGGCIVPFGALVTLDELFTVTSNAWPVTLTIGTVFLFYLLLVAVHHRVILSFFALALGTGFIYLLTDALLPTADAVLYAYLTMLIGLSYTLFGYGFAATWNARLVPLLYFFGPLGFYIAAFSRVFDSRFMELLFPFLAFGGLALAVTVLHSRLALVLSTLAVIGYIGYFTAEYFADSIGWPVALILLGFVVIAIGYFSISLNRRFIAPERGA